MDWKKFFITYLRNMAIFLVLGIAFMGLIGFLLAGKEGLVGGATWGLILGVISIPFTAFIPLGKYWSDFAGKVSARTVKEETEGKEQKRW